MTTQQPKTVSIDAQSWQYLCRDVRMLIAQVKDLKAECAALKSELRKQEHLSVQDYMRIQQAMPEAFNRLGDLYEELGWSIGEVHPVERYRDGVLSLHLPTRAIRTKKLAARA